VKSGNATLRQYNDENLEPFTEYEYYVVVYNTEGNVSSPASRNKTLMDAPEGLEAPTVIVRSARSIDVVFKPPTKPNGIISEYKLTRVDLNTTAQTLVYRGSNLSYVDNGVVPITGYFYILEVCTTLCSNTTSQKIYTEESIPENVQPPLLKALSAYSIEIKWQRPGRPNGVITAYNVSRVNYTGHIVKQWQTNDMVLLDNSSDIKPYTNYTYIITACTKVGCANGPRGFVVTLEAPPENVHPPELLIRSARVIEVNWREPAIPNGNIIQYTLYRDGVLIFETQSAGQYRFIDRGLKPHTLYSYVIEASTIAGSTNSSEGRVTTPQSTPEGIPSPTLSPQSSSSILVTWTPPAIPNGVITNYSVLQDTGIEHYAGLTLRLAVQGLKPFTDYNFQIKACTLKGCGVGNRSEAKTSEARPIGQPSPSLVALSDAVVRVTWRGPRVPNGVILSYEVERRLLSAVPVLVFVTNRPFRWQTLDSGLLPYRNYSYRIRVRNGAGSARSAWAIVRTREGAPGGFYLPTIHVVNATAVRASWREPREPNGIITRYELWAQSFDIPGDGVLVASSNTPEQNVTVNGLKPSTNYEFRLAASTVGGTGYSSWTLAETLEAPPLGLRPLTARKHVNGRELSISWDEPAAPNGRITNYIVYSDGVKVYSGISRTFNLRRLQPFTSYTFQLESCTSAGCTKGSIQTITTAEIPPDVLQAPMFSAVESTHVTLDWLPPALPNGKIILYQVLRMDTPFAVYNTSEANITSYTDRQLQPYTKYGYKVRALNSAGGTESQVASVTTRQAAPELVHPPVIEAVTSSAIEVSWSPPDKANGVITSYTLRRNESVINHWGYTVLQYKDTSVSPNTFYGYWLTVCTRGGCTQSDRTVIKSGEGVPGAVRAPQLTVISPLAIRVEWQPPVISNGIVIRYELYMGNNPPIYNGTDMLYVISNLLPYTSYTFHVVACTKSGCTTGPSSDTRTHEAPPTDLDKPTYTVFGPRILEIKWALPRKPNGVILYYTIHRNDTVVYNGTELSYKDLNVEPFTYYSYIVTAFNIAGHVVSPVLHTDRTSSGTPENVAKPQLLPLSGTEIKVSWSAPAKPNGIITKYLVLYNNIQVNVGPNLTYVARNLKYFTVYTFRVQACTNYPSCADSDAESTRTLEGVPRGQLAPVIPDETVMARSLIVTWVEPRAPNGLILRYVVNRTQDDGKNSIEVFAGLALKYNDTTVLPHDKYQYRVSAVNSAGMVTSPWTTIRTRSAPPELVSTPRILTVTQTSIAIAFDPPGRTNGLIVNYIVRVNDQSVSEGTHLERTITNLEPYTDYSLRVLACTVAGCTAGQAISTKTGTGQPGKVEEPSFGEVTANTIEVKWQAPTQANGEIKR
jgi:usherin